VLPRGAALARLEIIMFSLKKQVALGAFIAIGMAVSSTSAFAVGMVPEVPVLLVDEAIGEATINVRNTDDQPALLYTVIEDIPQDSEHLLVVTQPVARVEAGATQQLRFILQSAKPLETERLKRVIFEGILPAETGGQAQVKLGVRQNIPVILRPAHLPVEREPWKRLTWSLQGGKVQVKNASPYVVRLAKSVSIMPLGIPLDLPRTYVLPGEELVLTGVVVVGATVRLSPASTYGFAVGSYDAPLVVR